MMCAHPEIRAVGTMARFLAHVARRARAWAILGILSALSLGAVAPRAHAAVSKSISEWVSCGSTADQTSGAMAAFAAARNGAFILLVDCPVYLHSGLAVDRGIFIDNGTTVEFTGAGKFFVDNMFHPAFVIANSSNILLLDWNVEWDGSVPVNPDFGGYYLNGDWVASSGITQPAEGFNDIVLTNWLADNRGITFDETQGWIKSIWVGGVNPAAVFFITGDSSDVRIVGLNLYVPATAGGDAFMPMAFSASANWLSNQTVTAATPDTAQYAAVPHGLEFVDIQLDGTLMGWQGNLQDATFEYIFSHRYGDLQDAAGDNVGGIGKWFPPPHLFYLNTHAADPGLDNIDIQMSHVIDYGVRIGVARDTSSASMSGYANSLKLGCTQCAVTDYTSIRPDGFMDVLASDGLTVDTVVAVFNSQFLNNLYPAGLRFPDTGYSDVTFENVSLRDTATSTIQGPISNAASATNEALAFSNFQIYMAEWSGANLPLPTIGGPANDIAMNFSMSGQLTQVAYLKNRALQVTVKSTPTTVKVGARTALDWSASGATGCNASGAWSGSVGTSGSRAIALPSTGIYPFTLTCQNSSDASSTTVDVAAQ
jgi:hypothetical protein